MKAISKENIKILVVDDEFAPRKALEIFLKQEGYDITTANGGAQALQLLLSNSYDLVTTCIIMPGMNGQEMLEQIERDHPDVKVILMSGYTDTAVVSQGWLEPGTAFLQKPFTQETLVDKIREVLDTVIAQDPQKPKL